MQQKLISLVTVVFLLLAMVGCTGGGGSATTAPSDTDTTTTTATSGITDGETTSTDSSDTTTSNLANPTTGGKNNSTTAGKVTTTTTKTATTTNSSKVPQPTAAPTLPTGENVWYVSSSEGSDWNDGHSPDDALKSLAVAAGKAKNGDTVYFKRGDVWRGETLVTSSGVTYDAYGSGNKPLFIGSAQNYAVESMWKKTGTNIWCCTAKTKDVGTLVFNDGEATAYKRMAGVSELKNDLDFYHDPTSRQVYLYSVQNPGKRFKSIEYNVYLNLCSAKGNNITIKNLAFKHADYGIVGGGNNGLTITDCDFTWLGGCRHSPSDTTRFGNAIEIWGNCNNINIIGNYISQIYDTGFTCQYVAHPVTDKITMQNIVVKNNVMEYCYWSMEFYMTTDKATYDKGLLKNLLIEGNKFSYAGEGWSGAQRNTKQATHFQTFSWVNYKKENVRIINNTFKGSASYLLDIYWQDYQPVCEGNTFIQHKNGLLARWGSKTLGFGNSVATTVKLIDKKAKVEFLEEK